MALNLGTMLFQLAVIGLLFWLLKRYALKPVLNVLEERELHIKNEIAAAEQSNKEATQLLAEQRQLLQAARIEAKQLVDNARVQQEREAEELMRRAKEQAERLAKEAQENVRREKEQALLDIRQEVGTLVVQLSSKLLEAEIDKAKSSKLVDSYLENMSYSGRV